MGYQGRIVSRSKDTNARGQIIQKFQQSCLLFSPDNQAGLRELQESVHVFTFMSKFLIKRLMSHVPNYLGAQKASSVNVDDC